MRSRLIVGALVGVALFPAKGVGQGAGLVRMSGHLPTPHALSKARHMGRLPATKQLTLAVALSPKDPQALARDVEAVSNPSSPTYGQYLTPDQFTEKYSPTQQDFDQVAQYLAERGLNVTFKHANRLVIDVAGSSAQVEQAFGVQLEQYVMSDGRLAHAASSEPLMSDSLAGKITGIIGLNSLSKRVTHVKQRSLDAAVPQQVGSGPGGGLIPADLRTVYGLNGVAANGSGQTLGLFELDGYTPSDIALYTNAFGISTPPHLVNVPVDGGVPAPGAGAIEVTLDIEVMMALAPGAATIMVYEAPNTDQALIDTYARIATDNKAKEVSTSWGLAENEGTSTIFNAESNAFQQMAMQGQTIFAAAGDSGAFDDASNGNTNLLVTDDPASNPYMVGVGGTTLTVGAAEAYASESTWSDSGQSEGGGGGISSVFNQPSYQAGLANAGNLGGATTMRMVPDVSLVSDPSTGYAIKFQGSNGIVGGTSCAAPMWAAFSALVNQSRAAGNLPPLGFANPLIYNLAQTAKYSTIFHDIKDNSTNLHYPAVTGYDMATGWGSFSGAGLYAALTPAGLTGTPKNRTVSLSWPTIPAATTYTVGRGTSPAGPFTSVVTATTNLSFIDTYLQNGTKYYYVLSTTNSAGAGGPSLIPLAVTPTAMAPDAPTGVVVTGAGSQ